MAAKYIESDVTRNKATSYTFFFNFEAKLVISVVKLTGRIFWLYTKKQ